MNHINGAQFTLADVQDYRDRARKRTVLTNLVMMIMASVAILFVAAVFYFVIMAVKASADVRAKEA